jgi:hypothetical protein
LSAASLFLGLLADVGWLLLLLWRTDNLSDTAASGRFLSVSSYSTLLISTTLLHDVVELWCWKALIGNNELLAKFVLDMEHFAM